MCTEARYTDSYFIQSIEPRNQNPSSRIALCPRRVSFLKSGPFRLLCSTRQSRLKAGRRSQEAGHQPLTWGPRLGKRYLVRPRTHVLLGAAAVGQVETAGSTVVHGDEGRGSRGRTLDGRSQEACVVPTRGASVRAACRLARWPRFAPPRVLRHGGKEERTAAGVAARQRSARHARATPASGSGSAHSPLPGSQDGGGKDSGPVGGFPALASEHLQPSSRTSEPACGDLEVLSALGRAVLRLSSPASCPRLLSLRRKALETR